MGDFAFYYGMGWDHIINPEALDHLLFIAALAAVFSLEEWKQVLVLVTAFTVGHTITLALTSLQLIDPPSRWIEFLIPLTIVITAVSNILQKERVRALNRLNYALAMGFGLIHGMAFAQTLNMIKAEDQSFAWSMFSFSLGLESGQILVVLTVLLLYFVVDKFLKPRRADWILFVSAAVFGLALKMALERLP